jgi:type II restriction enzyme
MRNFVEWLSKFKSSISDYAYYVDFAKVHRNIDTINVELSILMIASARFVEKYSSCTGLFERIKCYAASFIAFS